jgi:hypothetical protein
VTTMSFRAPEELRKRLTSVWLYHLPGYIAGCPYSTKYITHYKNHLDAEMVICWESKSEIPNLARRLVHPSPSQSHRLNHGLLTFCPDEDCPTTACRVFP